MNRAASDRADANRSADRANGAGPQTPWLSIVIPAYNEAQRLPATLAAIHEYAERETAGGIIELIVVDDGSTDETCAVAHSFADRMANVIVLRNERNRGKGYSVRRGMLAARGTLRLMMDADSSVDIAQIERLLPWIGRGVPVVIASRDLPDSLLDPPQPLARRLGAALFRALRRWLLLPSIRDTQCGFKLFTARAADAVFNRQQEPGWLFDCEVLALAAASGFQIKEVGVVWRARHGSRVRILAVALYALPTLWRIRRRILK